MLLFFFFFPPPFYISSTNLSMICHISKAGYNHGPHLLCVTEGGREVLPAAAVVQFQGREGLGRPAQRGWHILPVVQGGMFWSRDTGGRQEKGSVFKLGQGLRHATPAKLFAVI